MKKRLQLVIGVICLVALLVTILPACAPAAQPAPAPAPAAPAPAQKPAAPSPTAAPAPGPSPAAAKTTKAEPVVLKVVGFFPEPHQVNWGWRKFKETVTAASGGEVVLRWVGGPEAISPYDQTKALQNGVIDMTAGPNFEATVPESVAFSLSQISGAEERKSGFYEYMGEAFKKNKMFYLGRAREYTGFQMFSKAPINSSKELSGKKFRLMINLAAAYKAFGLVGIEIDPSETYTALERGLVAGVIIPISTYLTSKWYEVAKYEIGPYFGNHNYTFALNLEKWNSLPKSTQNILNESMIKIIPAIRDYNIQAEKDNQAAIEKAGVKRIEFSAEDSKYFLDTLYNSLWNEMGNRLGKAEAEKLKKMCTK